MNWPVSVKRNISDYILADKEKAPGDHPGLGILIGFRP